jgi:alkanesulfonate monooxygenase SsuD/methylene tetrahydromethanopterin reductase-like flavin-dependent oxidoreductase (luciferase family)
VAIFGIRFDLRNPTFSGVTDAERYRAAIEMCEWADRLGFAVCILSEHHGADDGYLPSPLPLAAAIAARTQTMRVQIAALVASFHDPLRLAEDIAVVDLISGGRLDVVITNGYVASEFAMFGRPLAERAARTTEVVRTLREAWSGETFAFRGRDARVTPSPAQPGGPKIAMGGSTEAAARRAARVGDGFLPSSPELWEHYRDERVRLGHPDPGPYAAGDTSVFVLGTDVDATWRAVAPYFLHEVNAYGQWMAQAGVTQGGYAEVRDADALRETGQYRVLTPGQLVDELRRGGEYAFALFHPMVGGIPPALAWESLHLFEHDVLPKL